MQGPLYLLYQINDFMTTDLYNQKGEKIGQTQLPDGIFNVKMNSDLVHTTVVSQMANRRQGTAHTKDRSEKRGGGRKPWRQKGTGRARVGSNRSPLWRSGGVTFGPRKERNYKKRIATATKRKALFMVLSGKIEQKTLIMVDDLGLENAKTKQVAVLLSKLPCKKGSVLIVLDKMDNNMITASRNIPQVSTMQAKDLSALDLLQFKYIVMPKQAVKVIENTFVKKAND